MGRPDIRNPRPDSAEALHRSYFYAFDSHRDLMTQLYQLKANFEELALLARRLQAIANSVR